MAPSTMRSCTPALPVSMVSPDATAIPAAAGRRCPPGSTTLAPGEAKRIVAEGFDWAWTNPAVAMARLTVLSRTHRIQAVVSGWRGCFMRMDALACADAWAARGFS
ncbi:hypothetical protein ASF44_12410 [Pseudorhodoferax sp. Leaf274]|nr:hypothetical protein ASF44_12410 [Pseudorhodoferax sp. Leaf274]